MGLYFSKKWAKILGKKDIRILMLGLDGAGKTTMLSKFKIGEIVKLPSIIGFNVEILSYKGLSFTVWDIGGQDKIRELWKHNYPNTDGLIFVVDSNNRNRIGDAAEELKKILSEEELKDCPILVFANKQDLDNSLHPSEVTEKLGMGQFKRITWLVQGVSCTLEKGIKEGLDWMASALICKWNEKNINNCITYNIILKWLLKEIFIKFIDVFFIWFIFEY